MNAPRVVAAVIALSALSLGGCKSGDAKPEAGKPAEGAAAKPADKAAQPAKPAEKPAEKAAEKPAQAAPTKPSDQIAPLSKEREVLRQQRETLIASYSDLGNKAYAESRF